MSQRPRILSGGWTFGTLFTLIIVFFIYMYAKDHSASHWGWKVLMYITGAYLVISALMLILMVAIPILIILIALIIAWRARSRHKKKKKSDVIDVDFEVKEN